MRFLHAADIHLDSPLRGLERYEGAPVEEIRGATRKALRNLVKLAIDEEVRFVLIAGDLYDGDWKDYNTGLFFNAQMSRLREAEIEVFVVAGNHDAASQITKRLRSPENVRFLSTRKPETVELKGLGVALHGRGYPRAAMTEDLAARYPGAVPDLLNIGLLHTCLNGREGHLPYAPCSLGALQNKGYQYWALGHVHGQELLHEDPWIVFPGNIQGRHVRESGPKGCTLVSVDDGVVQSVEHRDLDVLRWAVVEVDVSDARSGEHVVDACRAALQRKLEDAQSDSQSRPLAARLIIRGRSHAQGELAAHPEHWTSELRVAATDLGDVWIEKVLLRARGRRDLEAMAARDDAFGALLRALEGLETDEAALGSLSDELGDIRGKMPSELTGGPELPGAKDTEMLMAALRESRELLLARLEEEEA